ncbi:MAG: hypothetical protein H6882_12955 [Rhodobiaceae bacterium]|nr:hypothetical protein [Rhodobiaceae bacterium]
MLSYNALKAAVLAGALAIPAAVPAHAEFGSDARRSNLGSLVVVHAGIRSPANCARIVGKRNGSGGRAVHRDAKPVTIIVAMNGGQCGKRNLSYGFQTSVSGNKSLIQLFFVSTSGKLLKNEKISISNY